jgi:alkaline phosphatase
MARGSHPVIARHLVAQQPDVLLGGGDAFFKSDARGGHRDDGLELDLAWIAAGGAFITNRTQLAGHASGRVMGIFAPWTMTPAMDRAAHAPREPSLPEMTLHAIRLLSQNKNGFFLMVEGARVDHALHVNDAAMAVNELLEFDQAVAVALQFARADRRTLLLIAADHETGGLALGNMRAAGSTLESLVHPLKRMKVSSERLVLLAGGDPAPADIAMLLEIHWGMRVSDNDAQTILDNAPASRFKLQSAITAHANQRLDLGWTSHQHTGGDVSLHAYGPCAPSGLIENIDIARTAAAAMRVDLDALTASLFADSREVYPGAVLMPEDNPDHLLLPDGSKIPFHDSVRIFPDGTRRPLGGLAVYIPETRVCHVPRLGTTGRRDTGIKDARTK